MAEAIAVVLTTSGHENKEYVIAAEIGFSFSEIAELISEITGRTIAYNQANVPTYVSHLIHQGIPEDDAAYLSRFAVAISKGEFDTNKSDMEQILGRKPVLLKEFLKNIYSK